MTLISECGKRMLGYLPRIYDKATILQEILQAQGAELDALKAGLPDLLDQFFPSTATWALELWEEELGLTPAPEQSVEERRSRVLARMRGYGTLTIKLLKSVAEAYQNGQVAVISDFPTATMVIRFIDIRGVPSNIEDLKTEIRRLVPARYEVEYEYRYLMWAEFDAKNWTWDQFDALGITWDELELLT